MVQQHSLMKKIDSANSVFHFFLEDCEKVW